MHVSCGLWVVKCSNLYSPLHDKINKTEIKLYLLVFAYNKLKYAMEVMKDQDELY